MSSGSVLVASSSLFMRIMLRQILGTLDLEVAVASNLKEIIGYLAKMSPDIVLIDLAGGGVGDVEIPRLAKNRNPSCAVIALIPAQYETPAVIVDLVRAGMDGYIKTPISAEQVKACIEQSLRKS